MLAKGCCLLHQVSLKQEHKIESSHRTIYIQHIRYILIEKIILANTHTYIQHTQKNSLTQCYEHVVN